MFTRTTVPPSETLSKYAISPERAPLSQGKGQGQEARAAGRPVGWRVCAPRPRPRNDTTHATEQLYGPVWIEVCSINSTMILKTRFPKRDAK